MAGGLTHGARYRADIRLGRQRWHQRQLYEIRLTSGCNAASSLL